MPFFEETISTRGVHELSYYGVFTGTGYIIADCECSAHFCFVYAEFDVRPGVLWVSVL